MNRKLFALLLLLFSVYCTGFSQTFTFGVPDTQMTYSNGDSIYSFHAHCENLLAEIRTLVFTLTPVEYPDTNRQSAVCTYVGCYPPRSGQIVIEQEYEANQIDTGLSFYVYNTIVDWSQGFPLPVQSPITGNYVFDLSLHSQSNPNEVIAYRFHLVSSTGGVVVRQEPIPANFKVLTNYPNPFNGQTQIQFTLAGNEKVSLSIYDMLGRQTAQLLDNKEFSRGVYSFNWSAEQSNGTVLPSGIYLIRLQTPSQTAAHKMVYIR